MAEEKEKSFVDKFAKTMFVFILTVVGLFVAAFLITSYIVYKEIKWDLSVVTHAYFLTCFGLLFLVYILIKLVGLTKPKKEDSGARVKERGKVKKFYDSNWLTPAQMKDIRQFTCCKYNELKTLNKTGIPVRAEYTGGKIEVALYENIHTLVIGTTGSGKTTQFVDPVMQILSETAKKPCFVVTDPKGEIYDNHSEKLRKKGYNVMVFDLRDPFKSTCWNPMTRAYELNMRACNLEKSVHVHHDEDPRRTSFKLMDRAYYSEWYEIDGYAFGDRSTLNSYISSMRQKLKNEAFEDLRDIATTLCPIQSTQDPVWERGAKDLVLGTMLAMLEDSENLQLGMTKEKFNFYNLSKILNLKDTDSDNQIESLTNYFQGRGSLSLATQLANQVVANAEKTAKSYMGIVSDRMGIFSDTGICYATSKNEMNLTTFCDQPTALFIKIPDEKVTRYPIATLFISQLYKVLVEIAKSNENNCLPRDCYFVLDEFGNMPKIENFENMITVARSRKIWFLLVLQSYAQLTIKYGEHVASTVKDNCNIHIFLASNDQGTLKEFSDRCGTISVETESVTISKGKKEDSKNTTTAINLDSRPLIYPAELGTLKDECIVSILKQQPIKAKFTPSYKLKNVYDMQVAPPSMALPKNLDEEAIYYDIKKRNKIVLGQSNKYGNNFY